MLYFMIGSRLNLWSIFYLVLMGSSPFKNLLGVQAAFAPFAMPGVDLGAAKMLYTALSECAARERARGIARNQRAPEWPLPPTLVRVASRAAPPPSPALTPVALFRADLAGCGVFFWKLNAMGLMPLTSSDWLSLLPVRTQVDYSGAVDALGVAA
jgi:hypothetical protein